MRKGLRNLPTKYQNLEIERSGPTLTNFQNGPKFWKYAGLRSMQNPATF